MTTDAEKDEVFHVLVEPFETVAGYFMPVFRRAGFQLVLESFDWVNHSITMVSVGDDTPTDTQFRHLVFTVYDKVWGGKPVSLNCVYKSIVYAGAGDEDSDDDLDRTGIGINKFYIQCRNIHVAADKHCVIEEFYGPFLAWRRRIGYPELSPEWCKDQVPFWPQKRYTSEVTGMGDRVPMVRVGLVSL